MTAGPFRGATREDRDALVNLWVEAWTAAMPEIDFETRRPWFVARLGELARDGALIVVSPDEDGRLDGFVVVDPTTTYLDQLAVRPDLRGTGLAHALMDAAKRLSPGGLGLHVNQDNGRAVRFYEREGFVTVSAGTNPRSGLPIRHMRWTPAVAN